MYGHFVNRPVKHHPVITGELIRRRQWRTVANHQHCCCNCQIVLQDQIALKRFPESTQEGAVAEDVTLIRISEKIVPYPVIRALRQLETHRGALPVNEDADIAPTIVMEEGCLSAELVNAKIQHISWVVVSHVLRHKIDVR